MTTNTQPAAIELMQLAKEQANEVDLLLRQSSLQEDTSFYKEMQGASHSVVDCLLEALILSRPNQFQKNFLVIAKACNAELQLLLRDCFNSHHIAVQTYESLSDVNKRLENRIVSFIRQLQNGDRKQTKETPLTTTIQ